MPQLLHHIDAIARAKGRDVLFLEFHPKIKGDFYWTVPDDYDWTTDAVRTLIVDWLTNSQINWIECGPVANPNVMRPYYGQIYLDVPFDETLEEYCRLRDFLEFPDGTIRYPGVRFLILPLSRAMENAAHDEPGFWERWAEKF
jgi:hypothetical protein